MPEAGPKLVSGFKESKRLTKGQLAKIRQIAERLSPRYHLLLPIFPLAARRWQVLSV